MGWLHGKAQSIPAFPVSDGDYLALGEGTDTPNSRLIRPSRSDFLALVGEEPMYPEPNFVNNATHGFEGNELVYACVMEKATSLPDAPFRVFGPDGMGESREDHPLRRLLANPNPVTTEFELMEITSIYMDLAGIAFWEVVENNAGQVTELWPLRPDLVRLWPVGNHYEYGYVIGNGKMAPLGRNVLSFKYPSPMTIPLGQAPMRAANRAVALDNEATDFVKQLLQNRAVPGTVIETEQKIDEGLTDRLTAKWIERFGGNNRGTPAFLQKGMKVHTLGLNLGELEFPDLRTISESRICAAFGVPPILVGAKVGLDRSTFANYAEARKSFWEETLIPLQKRLTQVIVRELMPRTEGVRPRRSVARFDNSEVLALKESEGTRWETALNALRAGGITINEFCRRVGLPTKPFGDVYLIPAGVAPVSDPSVAPAVPTETPPPADEDDDAETETGKAIPSSALAADFETKSIEDEPEPVRRFARDIAKVVAHQRASIIEEGEKAHALLALAPERKVIPWDEDKWNRELAAAIEPHMRDAAFIAAHKVDSGAATAPMVGYIEAAARNTAKAWNAQTALAVDAAVTSGGPEVLDNVEKAFAFAAGNRALTLAVSMSTEMRNFGKVDTAKRVGLATKTWVVTSANPREDHEAMDGETVAVTATFSNGQRWPSGPGCKCDVEFG